MGRPLPHQLSWKDFVRAVRLVGYSGPITRGGGSARHFTHPTRHPRIVTVHEPHPHKELRRGTLKMYLGLLKLTADEFLDKLDY